MAVFSLPMNASTMASDPDKRPKEEGVRTNGCSGWEACQEAA